MSKRILLISTSQRHSLGIQIALLHHGCIVEVTDKVGRAVAIAQHRPPSAILVDGSCPGLDSDYVAGLLQASCKAAKLPVVVLRSEDEAAGMLREIELGGAEARGEVYSIERRVVELLSREGVL